jgi:uncharacterized protein YxjI
MFARETGRLLARKACSLAAMDGSAWRACARASVHSLSGVIGVALDHPDGVMRRGHARGMVDALMPLLRRDRDRDQTKYRMREKMFSIGDDFWVENEAGERAFKVDGKALRLRDTLILQDPAGSELFKVQTKALHVRDTMKIERDGETVATVKKALVHVVRDRFSVEVDGGEDLEAKGNIVDHEYKVERDGDHVAEVSRRWFRVRDTYGIEIAPGEDDALLLAVVVCIDQMSHD